MCQYFTKISWTYKHWLNVLSVHTIYNDTLKSESDLLPLQSHYLFPKNDDNHARESNCEFFDDIS